MKIEIVIAAVFVPLIVISVFSLIVRLSGKVKTSGDKNSLIVKYPKGNVFIGAFADALFIIMGILFTIFSEETPHVLMTELIIWDENIIDFIDLKKIGNTDHYLADKAVKLYGKESLNYNKKLCDNLCLLKIVFIDKTYFEVVCNEVLIRDSMFDTDM